MKKHYCFLLLLPFALLLFSCNNYKNKYSADRDAGTNLGDVTTINNEPSITIQSMDEALTYLQNAKSIDSRGVGIAGTMTKEYQSYYWLYKYASVETLKKLTSDQQPYLRTYAFMALCKRNVKDLMLILMDHLKDSVELITYSGCIGSTCRLNNIWMACFKQLTNPSGIDKISDGRTAEEISEDNCYYPDQY